MYDEDLDDDRDTPTMRDLRKQIKALQKERDDARTEAAALKGTVKQRSIQEVLTSKGANPKLAKFALADGVEDEAGAEAWLAENGELFGFQPAADPSVDDDDLAAMRAVQDATATGGVVNNSRLSQEDNYLNEAQTPEEWTARANEIKANVAPFQLKQ